MSRKIIYAFLVATVAFLPLSCAKDDANTTTPLPIIPVKTMSVSPGTIDVTREYSGGLEGIEQADLYIRLSEAVVALPFRVGEHVEKGQVLIELDKGGASSQYYQAKAMYDNADKNYKKMQYLFEQKAISESAFDEAKAGTQVAKANFESAQELVSVTSPITGTLVELDVKVGDIPKMGLLAARVARTDQLRMSFGVSTDLVDRFAKGMTGTVHVSGDDSVYTCTITKVSDAAEPQTRTFSIEATVPNTDRRLQAGTFAKATFVVQSKNNVLAVPQAALLSNEGVMSLYVVRSDTAYSRTVIVGINNGIDAEIASGLKSGDEVVVVGQGFLSDGYPIVRSAK